ncbi:hypothetical protein U8D42_23830 [Mycobacterium europaeum]|nr:hypothetical protein [Mycobacterium europaeum]MEA1161759.1 hypothetical protein [Mycobacterium europaeum]
MTDALARLGERRNESTGSDTLRTPKVECAGTGTASLRLSRRQASKK